MQPEQAPKRRRSRSIWLLCAVIVVVAIVAVLTIVRFATATTPAAVSQTPIAVPVPKVTLPTTAPSATSSPLPSSIIRVSAQTAAAAAAAVAKAKSGDVVVFPSGEYSISALALTPGVRYVGEPGATVKSTTNAFHCYDCSGVTVQGFTFDGGNLNLGTDQLTSKSVTVIDNVFTHIKAPEFGYGQALFLNHIDGLTVSGNTFLDDGTEVAQNAVIGYDLNSATISGNVLRNVYQGIHLQLQQSYGESIVVSNNWISGLSRMGVEIQGYSSGLEVSGNTITDWATTVQGNRIGLSIVTRGTGHTTVTGNTVIGVAVQQEPALEFMGTNSTVENNVLYGFGSGISVACATGTVFSGNHISSFGRYGAFSRDGGYCGGEKIGTNTVNGVSVRSKL